MPTELSPDNEREFHRLLVSLQASANRLDLFVAICDDRNVQEAIIERYEAALQEQEIPSYQVRLSQKRPSLRASLETLAAQNPKLRNQKKAVVTVLGGNELLGVRLSEEKSEQEKFFFSLQWTREALREFRFPIMVWLSDAVATGVSQKAKDFWSWRSGVFEFEGNTLSLPAPAFLSNQHPFQPKPDPDALTAPTIIELIQQITEIQKQNLQSPLLITLYTDLGNAYSKAYAHELALGVYTQALDLAKALKDKPNEAKALNSIGNVLFDSGRYEQAIAFHQQSLENFREMDDRKGEAVTLNNLGSVYTDLGQYERAGIYHQQASEIAHETGDRDCEAMSLNGLGHVYQCLEQYQRAGTYYQQVLEIVREMSEREREAGTLNEAVTLNNLGSVYYDLGQYERAITFHQRALEIDREADDRKGEASNLNNMGNAYYSLGQYEQAIAMYHQALEIFRNIGKRNFEGNALGNLGNIYRELGQYERALDFYQQALIVRREIGDRDGEGSTLLKFGYTLAKLDRHYEAAQSYQQALAIYKELNLDHMVEKCERAIAEWNKIIAAQRRVTPSIEEKVVVAEKTVSPDKLQRRLKRLIRRKEFWFWVVVGVVMVVAISQFF